ncbi:MAG: NAD(P)H-hydrate dehydratase [Planctomycetales bacterium]
MTNDKLPRLETRAEESHKGDFGRLLIIGGSRGMGGAVSLAGKAALRSGAGLVTIATAGACLDTVAALEPCYMTAALPCDSDGVIAFSASAVLDSLAEAATVVACGPGMGRTPDIAAVVTRLYEQLSQVAVFDADALFAIAQRPACLGRPSGARILTPHQGEFARLINESSQTREKCEMAAVAFAAEHQVVLALKGHATLVTDGQRVFHNTTGNPGMATGGCGDVLTGLITGLVGQGLGPFEAAQLGVHLHGAAGDLAAERLGEVSMTASDLIDELPQAFVRHRSAL